MTPLLRSINSVQQSKIFRNLIWGSSSVCLVIWIGLADPINPIKIIIILSVAAWVAGHLLHTVPKMIYQIPLIKAWVVLLFLFEIFLTISVVQSDNFLTSLIGQQGRWNGLVTYISLAIISLAAAIFSNFDSIKNFFNAALVAGAVLAAYGFTQSLGKDFISWNNQYNSVITTAGNPNFSAAIMAIFASLTYGGFLNSQYNRSFRSISFFVTACLVYVIYLTEARQGLLSVFLGIGITTLMWIHSHSKNLGRLFAVFAGLSSIWVILGILQIGPLTSLLYKSSISVRGYYFKAGLEMFKAHPWFGVGLDRYGSYFKEFRDVEYPLKYGFGITSNNAHNVPIQFFATGGFFVGALYLTIILFTLFFGLRAIKYSSASDKLVITSVFSAWAAYQAQSFVSIDSPGTAVLGWLLSGSIIGLYIKGTANLNNLKSEKNNQFRNSTKEFKQPLTSGILLIIVFIFASFIFRCEYLMMQTATLYYSKASPYFYSAAHQTINAPLMNVNYKFRCAQYLIDLGYTQEGIKELEKVSLIDSRNDEVLDTLATAYYLNGNLSRAIYYREKITLLNPWDARNYLILGQLYKANGDLEKMKIIKSKIISFASTTEEGKRAVIELSS